MPRRTLRRTVLGAAATVLAAAGLRPTSAAAATPAPQITLEPSGGDDAPAWQEAIDKLAAQGSGELIVWPGTHRFGRTVMLPRPDRMGAIINVRGVGKPILTGLSGPLDTGLLRVESQWQYALDGLYFQGSGRQGMGLWLAHEANGGGTHGGTAVLSRLFFGDLDVGMNFGDIQSGIATSEILLLNCQASNCRVGFLLSDYNTLDIHFQMLSLGACEFGVYTMSAGHVTVDSGSASNNTLADFFFSTGGVFSISNFRSEGTNRLFQAGTTTATTAVTLTACNVEGARSSDGVVVQGNWGDGLTIIGCDLAGKIGWGQVYGYAVASPGRLVMIGTSVQDSQLFSTMPDAEGLLYTALGCRRRNADNTVAGHFPDQSGVVSGGQLVPSWQV